MTLGANPFQNDKLIKKTVLGSLTLRTRDSHTGDFGSVGILGGAPGMSGAVLLTARAALHLGAAQSMPQTAQSTHCLARSRGVAWRRGRHDAINNCQRNKSFTNQPQTA